MAQFGERDPKGKAGGEQTLMPEMLDKANKGASLESGFRVGLQALQFDYGCKMNAHELEAPLVSPTLFPEQSTAAANRLAGETQCKKSKHHSA